MGGDVMFCRILDDGKSLKENADTHYIHNISDSRFGQGPRYPDKFLVVFLSLRANFRAHS
jgi:hypothetical protein